MRRSPRSNAPPASKVEPEATFECTVNFAGGKAETATLKILNKDADVERDRPQQAPMK